MQVKIIATTGRARGEAVEVPGPKFYIGSHDNCQLRPDLEGLADIHALIERRGMSVFLRDFGAEGGTGLNDRVLRGREAEVFDGDLIQVGPMVLTLAIGQKVEMALVRGRRPTPGLDHPHHEAPLGWPHFSGHSGEAIAPAPPAARPAAVPPPPHTPPRSEPAPGPAAEAAEAAEPAVALATPEPEPAAVAPRPAPAPLPTPPPAPARPLPLPGKPSLLRALSCREVDGVLIASIMATGLEEEETVSPVRYELRGLIEGDTHKRMVIDLGRTRHLSSRAVGVILAHYQALDRQGGTLRVCEVKPEVQPVLDSMRLSRVVDIYPTAAEAVADPWD